MDDDDERLDKILPGDTLRQVPLSLRFEPRRQWRALKSEYGVSETGAAIILALWGESRTSGRRVSYSRTQSFYELPHRYRNRLYSFRAVRDAVDHLDSLGLIDHDKAAPGRRGWQSSMIARPELLERLPLILATGPKLVLSRPPETIILRDEDGELKDYQDGPDHRRWRRNLDVMNEAINGTSISGDAGASVVRIFNGADDFSRCGRIYAQGGAWQAMSKLARRELSIGGEPVVEVDYKTLHPTLLYAQVGAPLPEDAYAIEGWPRDLVKVAFLILVNASSRSQARHAIAHKSAMEAIAPLGSNSALDAAERLIDEIKRVHAPIAKSFHSDAGARLMRIDSDIAEAVVMKMLKKGILVLPIHDSFLVARSQVQKLQEAMTETAWEAGFSSLKHEVVG